MNNKKLIAKAALGDKKSLDFICEKYGKYVYFFCTTVISDNKKAENAFKKSFKAIFSTISKNPNTDNLDEIVKSETAKVCKSAIFDENNHENGAAKMQPFGDKDKISSASAITAEQKNIFVNALKSINANQRIVVLLNLLCDYNTKKIADILKISEDKVQNSLEYGRENIKKQLRTSDSKFSKRDIIFLMTASANIVKEAAAQAKIPDSVDSFLDEIVLSLAKPQKSDKKKAWIVISAVAVFLVAVIVVFVITSNKSNGSVGATNDSASASNVSATIGESQAKGTHHAEIDIKDYGVIKVELNGDVAPITVANFINLANSHFYDGLTFHRIIDGFMMQGGDPLGNGTGGSENTIKGEFSQNGVENNLSHTRGAISMARSTDMDSASSQFFIVQSDSTYLDGQYACFGYVTDGMDIVDEICKNAVTTDSNGSVSAENQPVINSITITD
ncbi:peptidylprolyl isomerase [uncultured Ruminococcus sp.]|uniref:peptidylprolyl isomerase n=1 Tax=uncultured Ruminococcus sp. TaxID=165186 RepID=UPI003447E005